MWRLPVTLIVLFLPLSYAQVTASKRESLADEAAKQVVDLNGSFKTLLASSPAEKSLRAACALDCSRPQVQEGLHDIEGKRTAAEDAVISKIHAQVDLYITRTVDPTHIDLDKTAVEEDLTRILAPASDGPPSAFVLNSQKSRSLIVAYTLEKGGRMGPGATSVSLRAYCANTSSLEFTGSTGEDMAGYGAVSVTQLPSPVSEQIWLLTKGQMTGANGPNIRMRIFTFDGANFRTVWMPENAWGTFTIRLTERGFTIDGPYYREDVERHDAYFLAPDGVYRVPGRLR